MRPGKVQWNWTFGIWQSESRGLRIEKPGNLLIYKAMEVLNNNGPYSGEL